jgi:uncharacterized RDD family membrane protein YckC
LSDLYENILPIDTPENVLLDAEIAGFGTRCVAALLDYLILLLFLLLFTYVFIRAISGSNVRNEWAIASYVALQFLIVTFYHLLFEFLWNGQTPGKRIFGIRVVQSNGLPLTTSGVIIRNFIRLFDFLPLLYGVGLIALFATKHTQRLGDLAAKTVVIREQRKLKLDTLKETFSVTYHHISRSEPLPAYVNIQNLTEADRRDVVDYLQRRRDLKKREYIVGLLAERIAKKINNGDISPELQSPTRAERFLEQVAWAFETAAQPQVPQV